MATRITLTRELAFASGTDASNAAMRKGGRTAWSDEDYAIGIRVTNRLLMHIPLEQGGLQGLPYKMLRKHLSAADIRECRA